MNTDSMNNALQSEKIAKLERFAKLLDSQFSFLGFRFGVDGLIGLIPGIGDVAGGIISLVIVLRAKYLGVREEALTRMVRNVLVDVAVGTVPVFGDAFDFAFKTNERNLKIAKADLYDQARTV